MRSKLFEVYHFCFVINSIQLMNVNTSTMINYDNHLGSSMETPMLLLDQYHQLIDRMEDYLTALDTDIWSPIKEGELDPTILTRYDPGLNNKAIIIINNKKKENSKRCI